MPVEVVNPGSPRHAEQMRVLGTFAGAQRIEYRDEGSPGGETYWLRRGTEVLTLRVRGNKVDGAFLVVELLT